MAWTNDSQLMLDHQCIFLLDGSLPESTGDWLQLIAASSWMIANMSSILSTKKNYEPKYRLRFL